MHTPSPLISFVVPVYNVENYLSQCIDSILTQDFHDYEIILVNDGSTDGSSYICDQYSQKHSHVKTIHKINGGSSDARNVGIKAAMGMYIIFIDSDDFIMRDSLPQLAKVLYHVSPLTDVVMLKCFKFFDQTNKYEILDRLDQESFCQQPLTGIKLYLAGLPKYPAGPWSKAVRRELLINNNIFFKKGLLCEDLDWSTRLFLYAKSYSYCDQPYYCYRQSRTESISRLYNSKKFFDILSIIEEWSSYSRKKSCSKEDRIMLRSFMSYEFPFLLIGYPYIEKEKRKAYKERVQKCSWLLACRSDNKNTLIRISYRLFGIFLTGRLLKTYLTLRQ